MIVPVFAESIRTMLTDERSKRSMLAYLIGSCVAALLAWPGSELAHFIRFGRSPNTFTAVGVVLVGGASLIAARFGIRRVRSSYTIREWFLMTPATPLQLVIGKVAGAAVHCFALAMLSLPFLVVGAVPSGAQISAELGVALVIFTVTLLIRCLGLLLVALKEGDALFAHLIMFSCVAVLFVLMIRVAPGWNPFIAVQTSQTAPSAVVSQCFRYLLLSLIMIGASLAALMIYKRRLARRRAE